MLKDASRLSPIGLTDLFQILGLIDIEKPTAIFCTPQDVYRRASVERARKTSTYGFNVGVQHVARRKRPYRTNRVTPAVAARNSWPSLRVRRCLEARKQIIRQVRHIAWDRQKAVKFYLRRPVKRGQKSAKRTANVSAIEYLRKCNCRDLSASANTNGRWAIPTIRFCDRCVD